MLKTSFQILELLTYIKMLKSELIIFFFLGVSLLTTWTVKGAEEEAVKVLTTVTFDGFMQQNDLVLVEFYAPWCGHCKNLLPEFEKAALILQEKDSAVQLAKVDCTVEDKLAEKYEIKGYPTIKFFKKNNPTEYTGGRTAETIVEWINKATADPIVEVKIGDPKIKATKDSSAFIGKFKSKESDAYKVYFQAADVCRDFGMFFSNFDDGETEQIIVMKDDDDEIKYDGKMEVESLNAWIKEQAFPLLGTIDGGNYNSYDKRGLGFVWFCGDKNHYQEFQSAVRESAKEYVGKHSFVFLDIEHYIDYAKAALGVTEFPALVFQRKKELYIFPEPETNLKNSQKIIQFLKDIEDKKIEVTPKSEKIPETNNEPVKIVVGKNFKDIVFQAGKDVFLEIYAPWCGHCKTLAPVVEELAEKLKEFNDKIVVAKMDGSANDSPVSGFEWTGFPTFFFIKAGTETPMNYEGGRDIVSFMEYIKKHASHKLEKAADKSEEL